MSILLVWLGVRGWCRLRGGDNVGKRRSRAVSQRRRRATARKVQYIRDTAGDGWMSKSEYRRSIAHARRCPHSRKVFVED